MICPVCSRVIYNLEKWRGIYICTPCRYKFEKIEGCIKNGQLLEGPSLDSVLAFFGGKEEEVLKNSPFIRLNRRKKRVVAKNVVVNIKPAKRKRKNGNFNNK